jgi:hypothetical protein
MMITLWFLSVIKKLFWLNHWQAQIWEKYAVAMCEIIEPLPSSEALRGTDSTESVVLLPVGEGSKVLIQERRDCRVTDQLIRQLDDAMALVLEAHVRDRATARRD